MKQTFAVIILLLLVILGCVYLFVPSNQNCIVSIKSKATIGGIQRMVSSKSKRAIWLPKEGKQLSDTAYLLDGCSFKFASDYLMNNVVTVQYKNFKASSILLAANYSSEIETVLNFNFQYAKNPISKINGYFVTKHIKSVAQKLLDSLNKFVSNNENIYGVAMKNIILKDSTLIAIKENTTSYPTISEIYKSIEMLRAYANIHHAKETNPPMLNIFKISESSYEYMVALPINKWLDNSGSILGKRMLAGGNILVSGDIKGGFKTVDNFLKEIENFKTDDNRISPAIPFQSLVTDRSKESDTSKWITKLYYPVF